MSKSGEVVIELIELRERLRFLFYLNIYNKLLLLQQKHSKYMYARCVNFPSFIKSLAACMHAFCMFYLYVSLGKWVRQISLYIIIPKNSFFAQKMLQNFHAACKYVRIADSSFQCRTGNDASMRCKNFHMSALLRGTD